MHFNLQMNLQTASGDHCKNRFHRGVYQKENLYFVSLSNTLKSYLTKQKAYREGSPH